MLRTDWKSFHRSLLVSEPKSFLCKNQSILSTVGNRVSLAIPVGSSAPSVPSFNRVPPTPHPVPCSVNTTNPPAIKHWLAHVPVFLFWNFFPLCLCSSFLTSPLLLGRTQLLPPLLLSIPSFLFWFYLSLFQCFSSVSFSLVWNSDSCMNQSHTVWIRPVT